MVTEGHRTRLLQCCRLTAVLLAAGWLVMPRTKKPAGTVADRRNGRREIEVSGEGQLQRFDLPKRRPPWSVESLMAWEGAWADPICQAWTAADRPILLRWIDHLDRATRALRRADRKPVVLGSVGQVVEHPSYQTASRSIAVAEKCEAQLGFGALNREKLGFTIAAARKSLEDLNREFGGGDEDEPDPRL